MQKPPAVSEVLSSAGACAFIGFATPPHALKGLIDAVTGLDIDMLRTGKRIFNMRHLFNLREGQKPTARSSSRKMGGPSAS